METVIAVEDLKKTYRPKGRKGVEVTALAGISFEVSRGEFFGLLGPSGAGKTTTIGILTTRVVPTGGVSGSGVLCEDRFVAMQVWLYDHDASVAREPR